MQRAPLYPADTAVPPAGFATAGRRGFTLIEILVVVSIILIIVVMALPAFNFINGSKSIDGAQNIIGSVITRARARAIGLQQPCGVFFFQDPNNGNLTTTILVQVTPTYSTDAANTVYIDLVPTPDYFPLPTKITAQFISQCTYDTAIPPNRTSDAYVGYNTSPTTSDAITTPYGGVILFDSLGRIYPTAYGFRIYDPTITTGDQRTAMGKLLGVTATTPPTTPDFVPPNNQITQFGFILYNTEIFHNLGYTDSDPSFQSPAGSYTSGSPSESAEETWLDQNATPLLINRYNGTLTKAE